VARLVVGIDVGTTACKAAVFGVDGAELTVARHPVTWRSVPTGAELDPYALVAAAYAAAAAALDGIDGEVAGVGVTGMGEAGVLLDRAGAPVAPLIAWYDTRDRAEVARLGDDIGAAAFARTAGLPLWSQWSATKHRWQAANDPAVRDAVRRLDVPAWVVRSLGGDDAAELSQASRTGWLAVRRGAWWARALEWSRLDPSLLPPLVTAGTPLGRVTAGPERLRGAVLTIAGHDHLAAAYGAGAVADGGELESCGTAEAFVRTVPTTAVSDDEIELLAGRGVTVGRHVVADRFALLGATRGGLLLRRVRGLLDPDGDRLAALDAAALALDTEPAERVELGDAGLDIRGVGEHGTPGSVWRAALRAATDQAAAVHGAISAVVGPAREVIAVGGWTRSEAFMALRAAAIHGLHRSEVTEPGARGAALLATQAMAAAPAPAPAADAAASTSAGAAAHPAAGTAGTDGGAQGSGRKGGRGE
jgi:sugar (pentulose or hexulose) kinase